MRNLLYYGVIALLFSPVRLSAQDYNLHINTGQAALQSAVSGEVFKKFQTQNTQRSKSPAISANSSRVVDVSNSQALVYKPSLPRRRINLSKFADQFNIKNGSDLAKLRAALTAGDVIVQAGVAVRPLGLRVDNVADAYTIWWITAWKSAHGNFESPNKQQFQAVKAQVTNTMTSNTQLMKATDEAKQELAEALIVQSILIDGAAELVKGDAKALQQLQKGIRKGAQSSGTDLDSVELTPNGFELSNRRTGALADDPLSPLKQVAIQQLATAPAPASDDSLASYALIAAAGGAGIAAVFLAGKAMGKKG